MSDQNYFFGIVDYLLFFALLVISIFIGIYVAFFGKERQNTINEYLLGSRKMGVFPTAMSLTASYLSSVLIAGGPSEVYTYGFQYWVFVVSELLSCLVLIYVSLPVFYDLQITSAFEYLNLRFNNATRMLISSLFILRKLLTIPLILYLPSIAFAQASGVSLDYVIPIMCSVCTFYTTIGGIKAVVWTDTIQMSMIILGILIVSIMGTIDLGGFKNILDISKRGERLEFFNMTFNLQERTTFWNVFFGTFISFYCKISADQATVQRCLSMPSYAKAKICLFIFAIAYGILALASLYNGLVTYAAFHDCDPLTVKIVSKYDQLLPYYVIRLMENVPGIPGIFVSGIVCAALTTLSTDFNSLAGVTLIDFIRPIYKKPIPEAIQSCIMKMVVVGVGCYAIFGAFFVDKLGNLIQTFISLNAIVLSPSFGVFLIGILFPWANSTGAIAGSIIGTLFIGWISLGTQVAISKKQVSWPRKPVSIAGCSNETLNRYYSFLNQTTKALPHDQGEPFPLYTIAFHWYPVIGVLTTITVAIIVSFMTRPNNPRLMDPILFSPVIRKYIHRQEDVAAKNRLVKPLAKRSTRESE